MKTIKNTLAAIAALIASIVSSFGQYTVLVDGSSNIIFPTNLSSIPASGLTGTAPTNVLPGSLGTLSTITNDVEAALGIVDLAFTPISDYEVTDTYGTISASTVASMSIYYSWFQGVNVVTNAFNAIRLQFLTGTNPPTFIRAVVRSQEHYHIPGQGVLSGVTNVTTWPILADSGPVSITTTSNSTHTVVVPLTSTVSSANKLEIQVSQNGQWVPYRTGTLSWDTNLVSWLAYANSGTTNPVTSTAISGGFPYRYAFEFLDSSSTVVTNFDFTTLMEEKVEAVASILAPQPQDVAISGTTLYAAEGTEANVYFESFVRAEDFGRLSIAATCTVGDQYDEFFRLTSAATTNITYSVTVAALEATNTLESWTGSLRVAANTNGQGKTRSVLIIGDSTTVAGITLPELTSKAGTNGFQLIGVGTQGSGTNKHEGRSGYKVESFYQGTASHTSPMTNGAGAFDFNFYLTNNSLTLASNDWVVVQLGINDVFSGSTDSATYTIVTNSARMLTAMVTNIQFAVPGVRVAVALMIDSAHSQDAWGNNYGTLRTGDRFKRNRFIWNEYFIANGVTGATLLPLHACVDTKNGFPTGSYAISARNATTVTRQNNAVHPANSGYYQIADVYYAFLKWWEQ